MPSKKYFDNNVMLFTLILFILNLVLLLTCFAGFQFGLDDGLCLEQTRAGGTAQKWLLLILVFFVIWAFIWPPIHMAWDWFTRVVYDD